VQVKKLLKRH